MKFSNIIVLSTASFAIAQSHNHLHRHPARHGSPVEVRNAAVTKTVEGPVVTLFKLNGVTLSWSEVEAGLASGKYVLVGDKISTAIEKPSPTPTPSPSSTSEKVAAKFFEKPSTSAKPTTTSVVPPPSSSSEAPKPSAAPAPKPQPLTGGGGIDEDFPEGQPCSKFPSAYGPVNLEYLKLGGWSGVQQVPGFRPGVDSAVVTLHTATKGGKCGPQNYCSYACPAGYQKAQFPDVYGSTQQSIGGLYCNSEGVLELTRAKVTRKLCEKGVGGVKIVNKLGDPVYVCRTDYPGTESETIPLLAGPGSEVELCNPDQTKYYQWGGTGTSAQYYVNPKAVSLEKACDWGGPGDNWGNWAPVNIGVGRAGDGVTYISLLPNAPTNPDGKLDFNIEIKGDISGDCSYKNGQYYNGDSPSSTGCTVSF